MEAAQELARQVKITGGTDPILPTPLRIGETSSAALAAVGLAVADLWELRTGRRQEIAVDTRQAAASLRSGRYMKMDGSPVSTERNAVMGVYPAKNGRWSYLHCNFPNHRAAALSVLGRLQAAHWTARGADKLAQYDILKQEKSITLELIRDGKTMTRKVQFGRLSPRGNPYAFATDPLDPEPVIFEFPATTFSACEIILFPLLMPQSDDNGN